MRRRLVIIAAVFAIAATSCTPEEVRWWTGEVEESRDAGHRCPDLAPARQLAGLPDGFDVVMWRESRCRPTAVNSSSGALGLTQIMPMWVDDLCRAGIACTRSELLDAHTNLDAARYVFEVQGWSAWGGRP